METQPKISIIMPVYKVEKFVGRAIESILQQTFSDYEFLIVDDGSPDSSGKICDGYAEKDDRLTVIHKENGGAPSARNVAIDLAVGKYLYFLDSDDWAEPTMLEDMYQLAEKNDAQLVVTGYYIDTFYDNTHYITSDILEKSAVYTNRLDFRKIAYKLFDNNLLYTPWNKLYLTAYIKKYDLKFPQTLWDDFPFNLSVLRDVERVCVSERQYYHFIRARAESETAKYNKNMYQKREEEHQWMLEIYQYWNINDDNSKEMISRRYLERVVGCVENVTNCNCSLSEAEKKQEINSIIRNPNIAACGLVARPRSYMMKVLLLPIKAGNVFFTYWESKLISWIKSKNIKLFATLKAKR
ncbi:glycosyltransferase family 2 protein [Oscillospiraceae bacterium PP1C4]